MQTSQSGTSSARERYGNALHQPRRNLAPICPPDQRCRRLMPTSGPRGRGSIRMRTISSATRGASGSPPEVGRSHTTTSQAQASEAMPRVPYRIYARARLTTGTNFSRRRTRRMRDSAGCGEPVFPRTGLVYLALSIQRAKGAAAPARERKEVTICEGIALRATRAEAA